MNAFDGYNRPPVFCGDGACDPYMRQDANALLALRFSTGRLIAELRDGEITIARESEIKLFGYGIGDVLTSATGYDGVAADDTMTNADRGGKLTPNGVSFFTAGLAARIGTPYLCGPNERYPSWLDPSEKIRAVLSDSCSLELAHGTMGLRYRLGSLVTHGTVFDYATGEGFPHEPVEKCCGKLLQYFDRTFATCALLEGHAEAQHRHGTIIWTDEDAVKLEDRPEQPFAEPKTFSPFLIATAIGNQRATVNIRTGRSDLVFENDRAPVGTLKIAIPIRVWLFGYPAIIPEPMYCGVPALTDAEIAAVKETLRLPPAAPVDPSGDGLWPPPRHDE